jgi:hypothetical protein
MISSGRQSLLIDDFFGSASRGLVEAQHALDDDARQRMAMWETDGIPPHAWTVSRCRLAFPIPLACLPKRTVAERTSLWIRPGSAASAQLAVTIGYRLSPLEE